MELPMSVPFLSLGFYSGMLPSTYEQQCLTGIVSALEDLLPGAHKLRT